jgi:hypothetical protein
MQTEEKKKRNILYSFLTDSRVRNGFICLSLSFALWLFVVMGKEYQYNYSLPVVFSSLNHPNQQFYCSDSVVQVYIKSTGFDLLTSRILFKKQNTLDINVDNLSLNIQNGTAKIPIGFINKQVLSSIGMDKVPVQIMPDTLSLKWNKTYSKSVPLVSRVEVGCRQPFALSDTPKLSDNFIEIEGSLEELQKIDTLYTKEVHLQGIDRNIFTFIPIDFDYKKTNLNLPLANVGLHISVKEYTENIVTLPVSAITGKNEKVRLFPSYVKVRYKVAMEDYKKVDTDNMNAYVVHSNEEKKKKLRVILNNVPEFIKVISIDPPKVDYVIQK